MTTPSEIAEVVAWQDGTQGLSQEREDEKREKKG
jgi:hypothetical protein